MDCVAGPNFASEFGVQIYKKRGVRWWWLERARGFLPFSSVGKAIWATANKYLNGNDIARLNVYGHKSSSPRTHFLHSDLKWIKNSVATRKREGEWAVERRSHETFWWNRKVLLLESCVIRFICGPWTCVFGSTGIRLQYWRHINCWVRSCSWPVAKHKKTPKWPKIKCDR